MIVKIIKCIKFTDLLKISIFFFFSKKKDSIFSKIRTNKTLFLNRKFTHHQNLNLKFASYSPKHLNFNKKIFS